MQIAITGGIAEGKSTVLQFCAQMGVPTLSADQLAREAFRDPSIRRAVEDFTNLSIEDRSGLRTLMLARDDIRRGVNHILHPWIAAQARDFHGAIEIPLLIETVRFPAVSAVVVVTSGVAEQRRRLMERVQDADLTDPTRVKMHFADAVVRTNDSLQSVQDQTRAVLELLQWPEN